MEASDSTTIYVTLKTKDYDTPATMDQREFTYLVGIGVTHSIAPPMHDYIAHALGYNWRFLAQECPTIEDTLALFRQPSFAGGVVTMPYKTAIMPHLDGLDEQCVQIGACNNVYRAADGSLRGTNTDWLGVKVCLTFASEEGRDRPALIIGAGGACRAAVYALSQKLGCKTLYIVNRDEDEVKALLEDIARAGTALGSSGLDIVHLKTVEQAVSIGKEEAARPYYVVGTVPDFEPQTGAEIEVRDIMTSILAASKGLLLDMCFKPRRTRLLKLGEKHGWKTIEGTGIIAHQIDEQYRLWCGEEDSKRIPREEAWAVLQKAAEESPAINF